jgi:SPP1 gp7 family putative phage head morphogenesis protein
MDDLDKLRSSILERAMKGEDLNSLLDLTVKTLSGRVIDSYRTGADFTTPDAEMLTRLVRDVWLFSGAKNCQEMRDLTLLLKDDKGRLREFADFKEAAEGVIDRYNETWLKTEYNFAVASSQNAARWVEFEKEASIIPNLKYQTVGDDHVRLAHQALDGIIRPVDDVFWVTHYPPNGWGCRCEVVQSLEGYGRVTPDKDIPVVNIPAMFKTNLAETGLLFPKNHPYYFGVPRAEISRALACLPPENTFIDVDFGNGVKFEIHPMHGDHELKANIDNCRMLMKHDPEARLKLLPVFNENELHMKDRFYTKDYVKRFGKKNADCLYNGKVVEFEEPSCIGNSVKNVLRKAKEQSNIVVMRVPDGVSMDDVLNKLNGQMKHYKNNPDLKDLEVWIMNNDTLIKKHNR